MDGFWFVKKGWVLAMKAPFLFWSEETGLTCPTPGVPYMPFRCTPAHSSAPGTTAHDRQQGRPGQMQDRPRHAPTHTPKRWTRCTGLHSIPDRPRRDDRDDSGVGMHSACMLRVQRFYMLVRLILNILLTCTFNHV